MRFPLNNKIWFKQILFLSSFTIISFLMKFLSEWTHEYLGHCCIGSLMGGFVNSYFVSWIWPLEFGYAFVSFFGSVEPLPRILMYSGGIITCLTAAFMSQGIIAILGRKGKIGLNWLLIPLNFLFWYGFSASRCRGLLHPAELLLHNARRLSRYQEYLFHRQTNPHR